MGAAWLLVQPASLICHARVGGRFIALEFIASSSNSNRSLLPPPKLARELRVTTARHTTGRCTEVIVL